MTRESAIVAATQLGLEGHVLNLLLAYIDEADMDTMLVSISQVDMGEKIGRSNISVLQATKRLISYGVMSIETPSNTYKPHVYRIDLIRNASVPVYLVKFLNQGKEEIALRTKSHDKATRLLREYKNFKKVAWVDIEEKKEVENER